MKKILIVDDDADLVKSTRTLLESYGYAVAEAVNGEKGLQAARKEKPDLMLLDVMMTHETEGFDVVKRLKEDPETRGLRVIIVTGIRKVKMLPFRFEPDEDWLPVQAVLEKPVPPDVLLARIQEALEKPGKS